MRAGRIVAQKKAPNGSTRLFSLLRRCCRERYRLVRDKTNDGANFSASTPKKHHPRIARPTLSVIHDGGAWALSGYRGACLSHNGYAKSGQPGTTNPTAHTWLRQMGMSVEPPSLGASHARPPFTTRWGLREIKRPRQYAMEIREGRESLANVPEQWKALVETHLRIWRERDERARARPRNP